MMLLSAPTGGVLNKVGFTAVAGWDILDGFEVQTLKLWPNLSMCCWSLETIKATNGIKAIIKFHILHYCILMLK